MNWALKILSSIDRIEYQSNADNYRTPRIPESCREHEKRWTGRFSINSTSSKSSHDYFLKCEHKSIYNSYLSMDLWNDHVSDNFIRNECKVHILPWSSFLLAWEERCAQHSGNTSIMIPELNLLPSQSLFRYKYINQEVTLYSLNICSAWYSKHYYIVIEQIWEYLYRRRGFSLLFYRPPKSG